MQPYLLPLTVSSLSGAIYTLLLVDGPVNPAVAIALLSLGLEKVLKYV